MLRRQAEQSRTVIGHEYREPVVTVRTFQVAREVSAQLFQIPARYQGQNPPFIENNICFSLGGPTRLTCSIAASAQRLTTGIGDIFIIPSGEPSRWESVEACETFLLHLHPNLLRKLATELFAMNPDQVELVPHIQAQDPLTLHLGMAILAELKKGAAAGRIYLESLNLTLALHLLRTYAVFPPTQSISSGTLSSIALKRVTDYIFEHLAQALTLDKLAQVVHLSPYHFARQFKLSTGLSVHQYVIRQRVEHAKQLLQDSTLRIADVAAAVGFHDHAHFTHHFTRVVGAPPSTYRRNMRSSA